MANNKKDLLTWLIPTLAIAIVVPSLIALLIIFNVIKRSSSDSGPAIAFSIGSLGVAWYGIFIFFGFGSAIFLACFKLWKIYKIPIDPFYWFCLLGVPLAILGARFWSYVIGDASTNDPTWSSFFNFKEGGLAVEGGVMLVVLAGIIYFPLILKLPKYQIRDLSTEPNKVRQVSMWCYIDAIVPAILIGQVVGRWGNYMNTEVYGQTISGSWANFVKNLLPYMQIGNDVKQPLFLIESFINFWGLILIYFVGEFIPKKKCGDLGLCYFLWYGIVRAILNPMRDNQFAFNIASVTTSIVWLALAVALLILNHTVFPRIRKYKIAHTIKNRIKVSALPRILRSIESIQHKLLELSSANSNVTNEREKLSGELMHLKNKASELEQIKNNLQINFVRTDDEMLYYLER